MENNIKKLEEEFEKVKNEIINIGYLKKGSIVKCYQTCGTASCKCHKDKQFRHGPYLWLTSKNNGKTKSILIPEQLLPEVKSYIENFNLLKSKVAVLEEISEKIIKIKIEILRKELKKEKIK
jgi:hypothetical protein